MSNKKRNGAENFRAGINAENNHHGSSGSHFANITIASSSNNAIFFRLNLGRILRHKRQK